MESINVIVNENNNDKQIDVDDEAHPFYTTWSLKTDIPPATNKANNSNMSPSVDSFVNRISTNSSDSSVLETSVLPPINNSKITDTTSSPQTKSLVPSPHVSKNHPINSVIGDVSSGMTTRTNERKDHAKIIANEVYVAQPKRSIDPIHPDHVYKLCKALYGLKQAPQARYDRLFELLAQQRYSRGEAYNTMFIKQKAKLKQTPAALHLKLYKDDLVEKVDESLYCSIISSLLYLIANRNVIAFSVDVCARYQASPHVSILLGLARSKITFRCLQQRMNTLQ
ncbi:retrotransposon protein, putative, unclassified [Cucumis melo var. makuwa]|uniref:Retrotransposon protein, putative, unclassified n=1 Tax=Cucumis melo var. makuwa TaxID=1194695 RepID=A0A5A7T6P0_CUCMM|nr:retrotransposon protein, putative, unclassified [Cucumis melo var. makuwa]